MSVEYRNHDLFKCNADVIVNNTNTRGAMGAGLALQFKDRYPNYFKTYYFKAKQRLFLPGTISSYIIPNQEYQNQTRFIISFFSKDDWKEPSKLIWIITGLLELRTWLLKTEGIINIAMTLPGTGLGKLPDIRVADILEDILADVPITVIVCTSNKELLLRSVI